MSLIIQSLDILSKIFRGKTGHLGFDIVIGTSDQVGQGIATHTTDDFVAALANGDRCLIIDGSEALQRSEDITETDITIIPASGDVVLDFGAFTLTMSGARPQIQGLRVSNADLEDLIITGAGAVIDVRDLGGTLADINATLRLIGGMRYIAPTLTSDRLKAFDSGAVKQGERVSFFNSDAAQDLILQDDSSSDTYTLGPSEWVEFEALVDAPSTAAHWAKVDGSEKIEVLTSGTTWQVPAFVHRVWAEVYGGGGGGRGGIDHTATTATPGSGGSASGVAEGFVVVTAGGTVAYTIGAGGGGGAAEGNDGNAGVDSTFSTLTGGGGPGGVTSVQAGGTASGGDINSTGAGGVSQSEVFTVDSISGCSGGSNKRGGGGSGGASSSTPGQVGGVFGGGGGGGGSDTTGGVASTAGGDGGAGRVIVKY